MVTKQIIKNVLQIIVIIICATLLLSTLSIPEYKEKIELIFTTETFLIKFSWAALLLAGSMVCYSIALGICWLLDKLMK